MASSSTRRILEANDLSDPITRLPRPGALETHLWLAQMRSASTGQDVAVIAADVDDFSQVIREHGWGAGDQVLAQIAERFTACLRDDDMVARMYGDVFAAVCENINEPGTVERITDRLAHVLAEPYQLAGSRVPLHVSIGTTIARAHDDVTTTIRRAEDAAKHPAQRQRRHAS